MKKNLCSLILINSLSLSAQEIKDTILSPEVMVNSSRFETSLSQEDRNVTILRKEELAALPVRSFQEILQYVNGVDLRQRGVFGSQADVSLDGGSFEQTLILLNGVKIIDHQTAHNTLNLPIPIEFIEQIEIIRGPAARVYGNNSLTGVINIITRKIKKSGFFGQTYLGSNFTKNVEDPDRNYSARGVQFGGAIHQKNHQHTLFVSHDKSNGYRYNTAFENNKILMQNTFNINPKNQLTTFWAYVKNGFGANGFYAAPGDKESKEIVETFLGTIQSKHHLNNRFILKPQLSYRYNFDDYRYYKHDISKARSRHYSNAFATEVDATYILSKGTLGLGLEYRHEQIQSTAIGNRTRNNIGFYGEYKVDWTKKINTNIGFYANYNNQYGWQLFPGLDTSYQLSSHWKWIANIGSSQRIPSFTDLYLDQRPGNIGNPDVTPEHAFQIESGLKWSKNTSNFQMVYFYRKIDDFIDWTRSSTDVPWQANNFGYLKTHGFNMKLNHQFIFHQRQQLNVNLGYSYLDSKLSENNVTNSKYRIESLRYQITNINTWQFRTFQFTFTTRYNQRIGGENYWINDVRMSFIIKQHLTVFADAQNIFNTTYHEIGAIPLPTRWVSIGLKFLNF